MARVGGGGSGRRRLTFAQAFNSLGTTLFPYVGAILILGSLATVDPATLSGAALDAFRGVETQVVVHTYIGLAIALTLLAAVVWLRRKSLVEAPAAPTPVLRAFNLLTRPRFAFGTLCIFLYVGGEVAIGSLIVSYLMQPSVLGLAAGLAGKHVSFYWGGAMAGRFLGSWLLRLFAPGQVLACAAASVGLLLTVSGDTLRPFSGYLLHSTWLVHHVGAYSIYSKLKEGGGRAVVRGSRALAPADPTGRLEVTILVRRRARQDLAARVAACVSGRAPGPFLSRDEFAKRHGADAPDLAAVRAFAAAHRLDVEQEDAARRPGVRAGTGSELGAALRV